MFEAETGSLRGELQTEAGYEKEERGMMYKE